MEKAGKFISGTLCWLIAAAAGLLGFYYTMLPGEISVATGGSPYAEVLGAELKQTSDGGFGFSLGAMKIKPVEVSAAERKMLIPGGTPFGIKLRTDGVMVISVNGGSPAEKAGIKPGDVISSVNGVPVHSNSEISGAVQLDSEECVIIFTRGSGEMCVRTEPEQDGGGLRIGAWVRDSAAGIGTLTFTDPETGMFAGLGHQVSDVTTGELMPLSSGEITDAEIYSVIKGTSGEAGELCGDLCSQTVGKLTANTKVGVFGELMTETDGEALPVAFRQEVKCGEATILATIDGSQPQQYAIEIEKINLCAMNGTKSMVIRVTDERLLDTTGGIVRGMSGSPIIQDGMLAGAVTHVFLNDPTRGYAVFAESMTEEMQTLLNNS
ncbi:MAG: SpoIVB peptidase [Oscillospiraceae bacterium]